MSGYLTHMAVGAAGGVLLARLAPGLLPVEPALAALALPAVSAVAATWPDIDHPDAWISERAHPALALAGAAAGLLVARPTWDDHAMIVGATLGGAAAGLLLGGLLLSLLRAVVGGHRGATHSLLAPLALGVAWIVLVATSWSWLPALLAWGWLLHILGDVVTPAGWRPLAPLPGPSWRLPRRVARHGETAVCAAALSIVAGGLGLPPLLAIVAGGGAAVTLASRRWRRWA